MNRLPSARARRIAERRGAIVVPLYPLTTEQEAAIAAHDQAKAKARTVKAAGTPHKEKVAA